MTTDEKALSPSRLLAAKLIFHTFRLLKEAGGQLSPQEIFSQLPQIVSLNNWDQEVYKTGYVRWRTILSFYTIPCVKTGYLIKQKRAWFLTKEGEAACAYDERNLLEAIVKGYRKWDLGRQINVPGEINDSDEQNIAIEEKTLEITLEQAELNASDVIKQYIEALNPYEWQELVAALLRGMGYYTPFIAPRGKDGGVDITAYRDPLGATSPRIRVQVKHRSDSTTAEQVRQLMGILRKSEDVGLFVSTGGFTSEAKMVARTSHTHVELIDLDRFISLWQEFYFKLLDNDKALLPLKAVYFLVPNN